MDSTRISSDHLYFYKNEVDYIDKMLFNYNDEEQFTIGKLYSLECYTFVETTDFGSIFVKDEFTFVVYNHYEPDIRNFFVILADKQNRVIYGIDIFSPNKFDLITCTATIVAVIQNICILKYGNSIFFCKKNSDSWFIGSYHCVSCPFDLIDNNLVPRRPYLFSNTQIPVYIGFII